MAEMSYIMLYFSYIESLDTLTDEEIGRLFMAMLRYGAFKECPSLTGNERHLWGTMKQQIDRDGAKYAEKCEKNRFNGSKGGRPKNQTVSKKTERFFEKPKKPKEKEKENEKENEKEKKKERESIEASPPAPARFSFGEFENVFLSSEELEKLKAEYPMDYQRMIDRLSEYKASTGKEYKNDLATLRRWAREDAEKGKQSAGAAADQAEEEPFPYGIMI